MKIFFGKFTHLADPEIRIMSVSVHASELIFHFPLIGTCIGIDIPFPIVVHNLPAIQIKVLFLKPTIALKLNFSAK